MNARIILLFMTLAIAYGCSIGGRPTDDQPVAASVPPIIYDTVLNFSDDQAGSRSKTGRWELKNGSMICRGYLMRVESEDYCSATVPNDWRPFTYDGETFYVQPLAGS